MRAANYWVSGVPISMMNLVSMSIGIEILQNGDFGPAVIARMTPRGSRRIGVVGPAVLRRITPCRFRRTLCLVL